jgi:hypothetical protein
LFYDSYFGAVIADASHLVRWESTPAMDRRLESDGVSIDIHIAPYFELNHALSAKGYTTIRVGTPRVSNEPYDFIYTGNNEYTLRTTADGSAKVSLLLEELTDLILLLIETTPLSVFEGVVDNLIIEANRRAWLPIPAHEDIVAQMTKNTLDLDMEKWIYRRVYDSLSMPSPRYTHIRNYMVHEPYDRIYATGKLENPSPDNNLNFKALYLPQYKYGLEVILRTIDMILEHDPNAVIVLQGDHGVHFNGLRNMQEQGYSDDQLIELNHSVISAVRIPPQFGGLAEALNPVDISRVLVNLFVGENYTYVSATLGVSP